MRLAAHRPDRCCPRHWPPGPSPSAWASSTAPRSPSGTCSSDTASSTWRSAQHCRRPAGAAYGRRSCGPAWPRTRTCRPWPTPATTPAQASSAWVSCRSPASPSGGDEPGCIHATLRAVLVVGGGRLEGFHCGEQRFFVVGGADQLGADREAFSGAADGEGDGGESGLVDGDGEAGGGTAVD